LLPRLHLAAVARIRMKPDQFPAASGGKTRGIVLRQSSSEQANGPFLFRFRREMLTAQGRETQRSPHSAVRIAGCREARPSMRTSFAHEKKKKVPALEKCPVRALRPMSGPRNRGAVAGGNQVPLFLFRENPKPSFRQSRSESRFAGCRKGSRATHPAALPWRAYAKNRLPVRPTRRRASR